MTEVERPVRCDRLARPWWDAVPAPDRAAIIASIPARCYVTVLARTGVRDWSVRVWRDDGQLMGFVRGRGLEDAMHAAVREAAAFNEAAA